MASSNRHWPSLFKAKTCNSHLQWQHDINSSSPLTAGTCQKASYSSVPGCEERSPEPKPRWNPKPEQIRILEAIFNSGMVNPPRDEIRRIRAQLQEYGQVGDANVFYWFQNRKSRSKHKQRHLQSIRAHSRSSATSSITAGSAATSSSSSSSERSTISKKSRPLSSLGRTHAPRPTMADVRDICPVLLAPATVSNFFQQIHGEFSDESLLLHPGSQEYCFSTANFASLVGDPDQDTLGLCDETFANPLRQEIGCKREEESCAGQKTNVRHNYGSASDATAEGAIGTAAATATSGDVAVSASLCDAATPKGFAPITSATADTIVDIIHGIGTGEPPMASSSVFINGVAFEAGTGLLNVREAFGEQAVLLYASGHAVPVNEWGATLHPLQPGASYYLV